MRDLVPSIEQSPFHRRSRAIGITLYALALAVLLPIDWFAPTGEFLREFGSKPASLVLALGGLYGVITARATSRAYRVRERRATMVLVCVVILGSVAFMINLVLGWSDWRFTRNPVTQFILQTALIVVAAVSVIGNARLVQNYPLTDEFLRVLPWAALAHLFIWSLEASGAIVDSRGILLLFRTDGGIIERATGLTSEPSYYGTMAALYGATLLLTRYRRMKRAVAGVAAVALYASALSIVAKTIFVVATLQLITLIVLRPQRSVSRAGLVIISCAAVIIGFLSLESTSVLNLEENLSSANRLGSPLLAINVISSGFGLLGIGFGQFHFFYVDGFAPDILLISQEATDQMAFDAPSRASTYNFFVRILLEGGLVSFVLVIGSIIALFRLNIGKYRAPVVMLFAGSLGFLLTQDTYLYPPLVLAVAMLLGGEETFDRQYKRRFLNSPERVIPSMQLAELFGAAIR